MGFGEWAVCLRGEDPLIGFCGFRFLDGTSEIELLYGIAPRLLGTRADDGSRTSGAAVWF